MSQTPPDSPLPLLRVLTGPTASGKSSALFAIAQQIGAEILSADSMKLYRGLNIGTAKPTEEERAAVRYHGIDCRELWDRASVADFMALTKSVMRDCAARGVPLLAEGGTALYLKALTEGLFDGPGRDETVRATIEAEAAAIGTLAMHDKLKIIDPTAAAKILTGDLRRIVRALEVFTLTGKPISAWQQQWTNTGGSGESGIPCKMVCLDLPRVTLYARIDRRVDQMLAAGWLDECRRLLESPVPLSRESSQALGYKTLFAHLRGEITLKDARDRICFDTHHFARHQLVWFKKMPVTRIPLTGEEPAETVATLVQAAWGA